MLVAKEGESMKDTSMRSPGASGGGGKRALGKAVQKGGLLLKGKNPQNVSALLIFKACSVTHPYNGPRRYNDKRMMSGHECPQHPMFIGRLYWRHNPCVQSISTFNCRGFSE